MQEQQSYTSSLAPSSPSSFYENEQPSNISTRKIEHTIIKFNIGGQRYEVSKSLLDMYPESMIAKSASSQWHSDPSNEIFIERDGTLFGFVLKYLRDKQVFIPLTVTKKELIAELFYYGIQDVDVQSIDDSETESLLAVKHFNKGGKALRDVIAKSRDEASDFYVRHCCLLFSADCIEMYVNQGKHLEECHFAKNEFLESSILDRYFEKVFEAKDIAFDICNKNLSKAGLKLSKLERSSRYFVDGFSSSYTMPDYMEGMSSKFGRGYTYEVTLTVVEKEK